MLKSAIALFTLFLLPQAWAQEQPVRTQARPTRPERMKRLASELLVERAEDSARITKEYADSHLAEIGDIVREQVLETLVRTDSLDDVQKSMKPLFEPIRRGSDAMRVYIHFADLKGVKVFVVGFHVDYGGWQRKVFLQGYRKTGLTYEFVTEGGASLEDVSLDLQKLNSPRENEIWLLAHGGVPLPNVYAEKIVLYSFDGYEFKVLWDAFRFNPEFKVSGSEFTVNSFKQEGAFQTVTNTRDKVLLNPSGPVVTTEVDVQKN